MQQDLAQSAPGMALRSLPVYSYVGEQLHLGPHAANGLEWRPRSTWMVFLGKRRVEEYNPEAKCDVR